MCSSEIVFGLNSKLLAIFAQNNGVIQLTGVASRHVGKFIAALLVMLGIFPLVGGIFATIPPLFWGGHAVALWHSGGGRH